MGQDIRPAWLQQLGPKLTTFRYTLYDLSARLDELINEADLDHTHHPNTFGVKTAIYRTTQLINDIVYKAIDLQAPRRRLFTPSSAKVEHDAIRAMNQILHDIEFYIEASLKRTETIQGSTLRLPKSWNDDENELSREVIFYHRTLIDLIDAIRSDLAAVEVRLERLERLLERLEWIQPK